MSGASERVALLAARGVSCAYGSRRVVEDFDLELVPGRVVALLGANGAGKTTALRALARLHRPVAGEVLLEGVDLWRLAPRDAARRLAYLSQGEEAASPLTVEEAALLGRVPRRGWSLPYRAADRAAVAAVLGRLALGALARRPLDTLSGGERRRAVLARALVQEAEVLILDEPTAHLDLRHQVELIELLRDLAAEHGLAVVASFHDLNQAARAADELVLLAEGRVLARGTATEVLTRAHLARAYGVAIGLVNDPVAGLPLVVPVRHPAAGRPAGGEVPPDLPAASASAAVAGGRTITAHGDSTMTDVTLAAARAVLEGKLKPPGSLGRLEDWAAQLAVLQRTLAPRVGRSRVLVFAADHGVAAEGVSAYPASVTAGLMRVSAAGTTGIGVLGRSLGVEVEVVDVGVDDDLEGLAGIVHAKVRRGSRNLAKEPALAEEELEAALAVGREAAGRAAADGVAAIGLGEMGIGNSTAAAALLSALTGAGPESTAGRGSGVGGAVLAHKRRVIAAALVRHRPLLGDPRQALAAVGGLELAAIAGAAIAAAGAGRAVMVDGFIATVAVLAAARIEPAIRPALFFAHRSAEPGHALALEALDAEPLLDCGLCLGEGTGAAIGLRILAAAADLLREMAVLEDAAPPEGTARPAGDAVRSAG